MKPPIDHFLIGTPDLDLGICEIEQLLGVRASPGGRHPRWGTHNALLGLEDGTYLEIIAPDPGRDRSVRPSAAFGLDRWDVPRVFTWALAAGDLESRRRMAAAQGLILGEVQAGSRTRPDGTVLSWRLTDPEVVLEGGAVPFLIDWGASLHPSRGAPQAGRLSGFRIAHPDPASLRASLALLGVEVEVVRSPTPALQVGIRTPRGVVQLPLAPAR